ncbi:MAG: FG-GAP-like repeat-containing protein [Cyclobacteriaceae bacterium]
MKGIFCISALLFTEFIFSQTFVDVTLDQNFRPYDPAWTYGCGASAVDYDKDGDIDLYLVSDENSPNRLYRNDGNGVYTEVVGELSVENRTRTALWIDVDADGRLDLLMAGDCSTSNLSCLDVDNIHLFRQMVDGSFEDITESSGLLSGRTISGVFGGLAAGDINNDGYLDIVMTQWGGDVRLYQNSGNGTFEDVTIQSGLEKPSRYWQPLVFDLNQDGWADIYLTVDNQQNLFYLNNGDGTFDETAVSLNLDNAHNDMGVALGDYEADQDFDIYVTNIERNRPGDHNVLLRNSLNSGNFSFQEKAKDLTIDQGGWGWGTTFLDADNDGRLDLAATNGWVAGFNDPSKLWKNTGAGFEDISEVSGFNDTLQATTLISFDMDRDGDLDLAQTLKENPNQTLAFRLLENKLNETSNAGNYVVIKPRMSGSNHWAIGSTVQIQTTNGIQSRPITAGISFYGQEPAEAHFGLGELEMVDGITVIWPGGASSTVSNVMGNQVLTITDSDVLHAPGTTIAVAESSSSIRLNWGHMSTFETHFIIERSTSESFENPESIQVSANQKSYLDTDLDAFTIYYYRIRTTNGSAFSGGGNVASARTESNVVIHPPIDLSGKVLSEVSIQLDWLDQADNEEGYTVQRSLSEDFAQYLTFDLPPDTEHFINTNIEPHTTYFYRVQAYRADGISSFSDKINLTTIVLGFEEQTAGWQIHPNPVTGQFRLISDQEIQSPIKVRLIDLKGMLIRQWMFDDGKELAAAVLKPKMSEGLYLIMISTEKSVQTIKLKIN